MSADLSWLCAAPVAHRGYHNLKEGCPENSLMAFEQAISLGYAIELDVQWLKDETPIVFHDETLDRLTSATGLVADHTWTEAHPLTLGCTSESIPSLSNTLEFIRGRVPVLIELKLNQVRNIKARVDQVVTLLQAYRGDVALMSFNPLVGRYLKKAYPHIIRGSLRTQYLPYRAGCGYPPHIAWSIVACHALKIEAAHYLAWDCSFLYPLLARHVREYSGQPLLSWTVTSPTERERLENIGVDNIIFEAFRA